MPDAIIYCESCSRLILPSELNDGSVVTTPAGTICPECLDKLTPAQRDHLKRISQKGPGTTTTSTHPVKPITTQMRVQKPPSTRRTPVPGRSAPRQTTAMATAGRPKGGSSIAIVVVAACLAAGVAFAVVYATRSGRGKRETTRNSRTTTATTPIGVQGLPSADGAVTVRPVAGAPTSQRLRLDAIRAMRDKELKQYRRMRELLQAIETEDADSAEAVEAARFREVLDRQAAALADQAIGEARAMAATLVGMGRCGQAASEVEGVRERFAGTPWYEDAGKKKIDEVAGEIVAGRRAIARKALSAAAAALAAGKTESARRAVEDVTEWTDEDRAAAKAFIAKVDGEAVRLRDEAQRRQIWSYFLADLAGEGAAGASRVLEAKRDELVRAGHADKLPPFERLVREAASDEGSAAALILEGEYEAARVKMGADPSPHLARALAELETYTWHRRGLVGWWRFDEPDGETARDSSGSGHHGRLEGGPKYTAGKLGRAIELDGTNGYVDLSEHAADLGRLSQGSISLWFRMSAQAGMGYTIFSASSRDERFGIFLGLWEKHLWVEFWQGAAQDNYKAGSGDKTFATNRWYHYAEVFSDAGHVLYIDGQRWQLDYDPNRAGNASNGAFLSGLNAQVVGLGGNSPWDDETGWMRRFPGSLDDVRIYDRPLSADEVTRLAAGEGSAATAAVPAAPRHPSAAPGAGAAAGRGPVAWWEFDEATGVKARDASGNGSDGVVTGSAIWQPRSGRAGGCIKLDGRSGHVRIPRSDSTAVADDFTVTLWVKLEDAKRKSVFVNSKEDWKSARGFWLDFKDGQTIAFIGGNNRIAMWDGHALGTEWHHIAVAVRGTNATLFVDGLADRRPGHVDRIVAASGELFIGSDGSTDRLRGAIDDVRLYDRALSGDEIRALARPESEPGLVAHYTFDEGDAARVQDKVTGAKATVVGGPRPVAGKRGGALAFDGVDDGLVCPVPKGITLAEVTVALWVDVPATGWEGWRDWWELGTGRGILVGELLMSNGKSCGDAAPGLYGLKDLPGEGMIQLAKPKLAGAGWHQLTYTMSDSKKRAGLYLDGRLVGTTVYVRDLPVTGLSIGFAKQRGGNHVRSSIDDVRIYDRALTAKEVASVYHGKRLRAATPARTSRPAPPRKPAEPAARTDEPKRRADLITNGGFESVRPQTRFAASWLRQRLGGRGEHSVRVVRSDSHGGARCVELRAIDAGPYPGIATSLSLPKGSYEVKVWARTDAGASAVIRTEFGTVEAKAAEAGDEWSELTFGLELRKDYGGTLLKIYTTTAKVRVWIDDVSLKRAP